MFVERIETLLVGNATGLVKTFSEGGTAADAFAAKTTTSGRLLDTLGIRGMAAGQAVSRGLQIGAGLGALAIGKMAFDGVQAFADQTAAARGFQRVMGGTAEDASRVSAAMQRMGIDAGTAQTAIGQLAKRIGTGKDTLAEWGVQIERDHDGNVNFAATLANVSEKYRSIPDAAERARFASENFGKGYQSINSFLGQGKKNLEEFYRVADQHHQVFSQDDLDKGLQYSRSLKDLDAAITGVEMSLGSGLVPLLTGTAKILDAVFSALDDVSGAMGGFNLNAVAMGALIGTTINPGLGTLIGAGIGAAASLFNLGDSAAEAKSKMQEFDKQLTAMDAKKAAREFLDLGNAYRSLLGDDTAAKALIARFRELATTSPATAQKVIDGMKQMGTATGPYEAALARVITRKREEERQTAATQEAETLLTGSFTDQIKVLDALADAVSAQFDKNIAAERSALQFSEAVDTYNQSLTDGTSSTSDQANALLDAESAAIRAAEAARAKAEADHEAEGSAIASAYGSRAQVEALVGVRDSLDPANPLRQWLDAYIGKLNDPAVNGEHAATLSIIDQATWALIALHLKLQEITGQPWQVVVQVTNEFDNAQGMPGETPVRTTP